jgi:hypothetical protein
MVVVNSGPKIRLSPAARETNATKVTVWYNRGCKRIDTGATDTERDATVIDIPEFSNFLLSYVKCKVLGKEGNPMLPEALQELANDRQLMVDTLQQMVPDNDDQINGDLSLYEEMN